MIEPAMETTCERFFLSCEDPFTDLLLLHALSLHGGKDFEREIVVIDTMTVPEAAKATLLERIRGIHTFVKTLPGFVEGWVYIQQAGAGKHTIIVTAIWENASAAEQAQQAV